MTNFEKTEVVDMGLALMSKSGNQIEFTRVETGAGIYSTGEDVSKMTELRDMRQEFPIMSIKNYATYAEIKFVISNQELSETYLHTEIGIYANDPDVGEILYALCCATSENAEKIQKYNGIFESRIIVSIIVHIASGKDAIFCLPEGIYALEEELQAHIDDHENPHDVVASVNGQRGDVNVTTKSIGAVSNTDIKLKNETVTDLETNFRGRTYGENEDNYYRGNYITAFRNNTSIEDIIDLHSTGIAFGGFDTHGWICPKYSEPDVVVGGGNGNKLNWTKHLAFLDSEVASAIKATQDGSGHDIEETYATKESLDAKRDLAYTKLPDGSDLNDATTPGGYFLHHQNTYINKPSQLVNGFMEVMKYGDVVKQIVYRQGTIGTNDWTVVERTAYSGTWSDWVEIVTEKTGFSYGVKTTLANPSAKTSYYIPFILGSTSGNKNILQNNELRVDSLEGTASALGYDALVVGNNTPKGTEGNKYGQLSLYSESAYVGYIKPASLTGNRAYTLPDKAGTFAMTSDIVSSSATTSAAGLMSAADKTKLNALGFQVKKGTSVTINASRHCIAMGWVEDDYFCIAEITTGNITNIWYNGCSFSLSGNTLTLGSASTSSTHFIAVWQE